MNNLRGIDSFVKAVQTGSVAAAARLQGISPAAASQNIARLEAELGVRLLTRTTRTLSLTESGKLYFEQVQFIVSGLEQARDTVMALRDGPRGNLRIGSSVAFGRDVMTGTIPEFCDRYPDISVELIMTDGSLDHIRDNIDVSIRYRNQLEPNLTARKIAAQPMLICASPAFLQRNGVPQEPEDLSRFDCLVYRLSVTGRLLSWGFVRNGIRFEPELKAKIISNDIHTLMTLAVEGVGITRLGSFIAGEAVRSGQLVTLFQNQSASAEVDAEPLDFYLCVRDKLAETPKIRAFMDFIANHPRIRQYRL